MAAGNLHSSATVRGLQSHSPKQTQVITGPIICRVCGKQLHLTAKCCEDCGTPVPGRVYGLLWTLRGLLLMVSGTLLVAAFIAPGWGTAGWVARLAAGVVLLALLGLSFLLTMA
jgi:ribosomal protein L37E